MPQHLKAGSPEGCNPFGRGLGVSPSTSYYSPFLPGRGLGGWCARTASGYPQGAPLRVLGVPRAPNGESRGVQPHWQGSGGVPQHFLLFPLPERKGARGMVRTDGQWVPTRGTPTGDGVPRAPNGESRGVQPLWQGSGGVPQHFSLSPLPSRKGARGMVRASIEAQTPASGESRGVQPLWQGSGGVPQHFLLFPLPGRKGARGMVPRVDAAAGMD